MPYGSDFSVEHSAHCQGTSALGMCQQACLWFAFCSPELPHEVANRLLAVGGGRSEAFGCLGVCSTLVSLATAAGALPMRG